MKALEKAPELRPVDAAVMRQELLAVLAEPVGPAAPKKRGEGKKTERGLGLVPHEVPVPKPLAGGLPVGVVASRETSTGNTLVMSLAACGFQVRAVSEEEPLQGFGALLFVADGRESLVPARALASRPGAPPVLLCGPAEDWELVTGALEGGLFDFVPLPLDPLDLTRKVSRAQKSKR
jgi:serine/threonine-protein kinase